VTTIAAIKGDGWAVVGYDSRVTEAGRVYSLPAALGKVTKKGDYLIGVAGDVRGLNVVAHVFVPPPLPAKRADMDKFMTAVFIPALMKSFAENGVGDTTRGSGCDLLVVVRGEIYEIGEAFEWCRDERGIYAIGSGGSLALGALYATAKEGMTLAVAKRLVRNAVTISTQLDNGSGLPVTVVAQEG
jgi:ATP-dependent protease HslVU (ClpYQ) peptidase subunit